MTAADELFAVLRLSGEDRAEAERLMAARDAEVLTETAADLKAHCLEHNRFAATGFMDCPCRVADELLRKARETRRAADA